MRLKLTCFLLAAAITGFAQTSRPFSMATTAIQADPKSAFGYENYLSSAALSMSAGDADVVSAFPEYLGIPYAEFAASAIPPATHPWTVKMKALASAMRALGKPLMLQIVLTRSTRIANAINSNGTLTLEKGSTVLCFDFAAAQNANIATAYVNYAKWMTTQFAAAYVVVAIEANLYYVNCGGDTPAWRALVQIERNAYDALKLQKPTAIVFPSFKVEDLYGQTLTGFDEAQYAAMSQLKRDRFGIASYPVGLRRASGEFINPYDLPLDYLGRVRNLHPSEPKIVITETGWNSSSISIGYQGTCLTNYVYSQESFSKDYLQLVLYSGYLGSFDLIAWWSDRDLVPESIMNACVVHATPPQYPECNGDPWCADINQFQNSGTQWSPAFAELVFKVFGTMGLRKYDGTSRGTVIDLWNRILVLPRQ